MPGIKNQEMSENTPDMDGEQRYDKVYGETFAMYSKADMVEFIEPFKIRFLRNSLDAEQIFKGKRCFDAGCGNGRGSLFMLMNGAAQVTAYDISRKNMETTRKFAAEFGFANIRTQEGSLEQIPFQDESFDFVWCNGVIQHTEHPNQCLSELARILKTSGQMWLYIYGSGGVYWRTISHLREMLKHINVNTCMAYLKLFRYPTRYIAEFIDDWYTTYLRSYTHEDLSNRLQELGFAKPELLRYGTDYDTSHRITLFATEEEKALMGQGDLRYVLTKMNRRQGKNFLLDEGEYGSHYAYPEIIKENIDPLFREIIRVAGDRDWLKIAIAAHIQRELRILLNEQKHFRLADFLQVIRTILGFAIAIEGFATQGGL
jgi:ubiquinone/menaquinone biosynthesis C-methylase UbiE